MYGIIVWVDIFLLLKRLQRQFKNYYSIYQLDKKIIPESINKVDDQSMDSWSISCILVQAHKTNGAFHHSKINKLLWYT